MFKIKERYQDIIVLLLITFLIYSNLNLIEYGLPYFENRDENSFKISSLAYLYKITGNKFYLAGDPFVAPLINLLIILKIKFLNDFF